MHLGILGLAPLGFAACLASDGLSKSEVWDSLDDEMSSSSDVADEDTIDAADEDLAIDVASDAGDDGVGDGVYYEVAEVVPISVVLSEPSPPKCPSWQEVGPWAPGYFQGVWAESDQNVWGLKDGGLWHWDGAHVTMTPLPCGLQAPSDLFGVGAELWATTMTGTVWHRDAAGQWDNRQMTDGDPMRAISGNGASDIWAVGSKGFVAHWDGHEWVAMRLTLSTGEAPELLGVWAGATEVWAVGSYDMSSTFADGPAAAFRFRGGVWERMFEVPGFAESVWGWDEDNVIVGGRASRDSDMRPLIQRFDGDRWIELPVPRSVDEVRGIAGINPDDLWIFGMSTMTWHYAAGQWKEMLWPSPNGANGGWISDLWPSAGGAWGFAGSRLSKFDGDRVVPLWQSCCYVNDIAGSGPNDVWLFGERGLAMHWDGVRYTLDTGIEEQWPDTGAYPWPQLRSAWVAPSGDVWAVGSEGAVWRRDVNAEWHRLETPSTSPLLTGVWGSGARVWITGLNGEEDFQSAEGVLWEWDGSQFEELFGGASLRTVGGLRGIDGTTEDDVWVVGRGDSMLHFDGVSWTPIGVSMDGVPLDANISVVVSIERGRAVAGGAPDRFSSERYYGGIIVSASLDGAQATPTAESEQIQKLWISGVQGVAFDTRPRAWLLDSDGTWKPGIDLGGAQISTSIVGSIWDDGARLWLTGFDGHVWRSPPLNEVYESLRQPAVFPNWPFGTMP